MAGGERKEVEEEDEEDEEEEDEEEEEEDEEEEEEEQTAKVVAQSIRVRDFLSEASVTPSPRHLPLQSTPFPQRALPGQKEILRNQTRLHRVEG